MNNTKLTSEISTPDGRTTEFKTYANYLRARIADLGRLVQCFKKHPGIQHADLRFCKVESDRGEMVSNVILAYRHLEDASMRLGKAIQAYDGGVSCYADVGHGQEIPQSPIGEVPSDAVNRDGSLDLKSSEPWIRDLSGNQITEGAFKWLQTLAGHVGFTIGLSASGHEGRSLYHIYSASQKVASYGEIKSVFCFLSEKLHEAKQPMTHHDALSWPAGESSAPPFVQPPQPFAKEQEFSVWARAKAHELGWQMSTDFNWGHTFAKPGTWSRHFKTEGEIRDFLTRQEKEHELIKADVNAAKEACRKYTEKPFTDESHSA